MATRFPVVAGRALSVTTRNAKTRRWWPVELISFYSLKDARTGDAGRSQSAQAIALMRAERREILRDAVFLCVTPLVTERMISGWAALKAS